MRIHINFTASKTIVPFDHLEILANTVHKWLGIKDVDNEALFSFSKLNGGINSRFGLEFSKGAKIFISMVSAEMYARLISCLVAKPELNWGLKVLDFQTEPDPDFSTQCNFQHAAAIVVKWKFDDETRYFVHNELETSEMMKETLRRKMAKVGLTDESLDLLFDQNYKMPIVKTYQYNGIAIKANLCPIVIKGKPETKQFAWNVGVGNSTGIGFGAIM